MAKRVNPQEVLKWLLAITVIVALIGSVALMLQARSPEAALTELLAFGVSVSALALAALLGINNYNQTKMLRSIAKEMRTAIQELKDIDADNERIKRKISQDYELAKDIIEALDEAGIGHSESHRRDIAGKIEKKLRTDTRK